jgi:glycosyltransferase involved in cell wall biosynthesis
MTAEAQSAPATSCVTRGIVESRERDIVVLSPADRKPFRRIIYLDSYGGASMWEKIKNGDVAPHLLRGSLELVRMGYEVALAEPVPDNWKFRRKPFPHDLPLFKLASWLGRDGIIFCGYNVLVWMPFFRRLGIVRCHIVSQLFGREELPFSRAHSGIIALTPNGAEEARRLAPKTKVAHLSWGADLSVFPQLPYFPEAFFSCGITLRDHRMISLAATRTQQRFEVICAGLNSEIQWPANVKVTDGGRGWNFENKKLSYHDLLHKHYGRSAASLLILQKHPHVETTAAGFTELIEVMAMGRPIIATRSAVLAGEIDIEKAGWGIFVPYEDAGAIAEAVDFLGNNPDKAEEMGRRGRQLAESYYNMDRYARDLHKFFESL